MRAQRHRGEANLRRDMNEPGKDIQDLRTTEWIFQYKRRIISYSLLAVVVSIVAVTITVGAVLRVRLIDDSKAKTRELGEVIRLSFGSLMLAHNPDAIQTTLETIQSRESSVVKAFILNRKGRVAYSSDKRDIGVVMDRFREESCRGCHVGPEVTPRETTMLLTIDGHEVLRNVEVIYNQEPCHLCHSPADRINGKLIIDRSTRPTHALISRVELMLAASGAVCLIVLMPLLSRVLSKGVDKYINEILLKSTELSWLYGIVERWSRTVDMDELRHVVVEVVREVLDADQIDIVFKKEKGEYGGIVWKKADNKTDRRKFPADDPDRPVISTWMTGKLAGEKISLEKSIIYLPIMKGTVPLALIIARKSTGTFDLTGLTLVKAMEGHIAVALENAALHQIAITDELTGLYSQRHFRNFMEKNFVRFERHGEKLALLMIDVDNFKSINDTYGHPAGDQALKSVAQCILSTTRGEDADFRYGGEEFAVILLGTGGSGATFVAERIRQKVESTEFTADAHRFNLTVSVGVAICPENATTIREFVSAADKALYEAKKAGKNRVVLSGAAPGGRSQT
ncbi:MAG: GGDEF domain-containing protein [Nitrospirota bacterium]